MDKLEAVFDEIRQMTEKVNVDAVFGTPEAVGDRVLIPIAEVMYTFGLGGGTAPAPALQSNDSGDAQPTAATPAGETPSASGAGGGGAAKARPIAYIEVTAEGAQVHPIEDEQKIALAGMLLGAWTIGWVGLVLTTLFQPRKR